jgi:hypothetical protein
VQTRHQGCNASCRFWRVVFGFWEFIHPKTEQSETAVLKSYVVRPPSKTVCCKGTISTRHLQFSHNCLSWQVWFWDVYSIVLRCLSLQTSQLQPGRGGSCIKTATRVDVVPFPRTKWTQLSFLSCDVSGVCTLAAVAVEGRPLAAYAARAVRGDPAAASKPLSHLVSVAPPPHTHTHKGACVYTPVVEPTSSW